MAYRIDPDGCINCGWCRRACPTETVVFFLTHQRTHVIKPEGCIDCAICARVCPVNVIAYDPEYQHDPLELAAAKERARAWARRQREAAQRRKSRAAAAAAAVQPVSRSSDIDTNS
ncbi:MAG TPA: ferredoxin family protein [Dehalococcoidia bacterium]|jgi:NAD-dependent dihydropyrimidine dehydrogenase PreA subunit